MTILAFGEETPDTGTAVEWTTWSDGDGSPPDILGGGYGQLILDEGAEARSAVYDLESASSRFFSLSANEYGSGVGNFDFEIRGAATSFLQDDATPTWEAYNGLTSRLWQYVQIRVKRATNILTAKEITSGVPSIDKAVLDQYTLSMWLQPENIDSKDEIDAVITFATAHGFTDLYASFTDWGTNPKTTLGVSTLGNESTKTADGKLPYTYLIEQANAVEIKVHAWVVCHFASHWCGSSSVLATPLTDNSTNHSTTNGGDCFNFSTEAARDAVTDFLADIADNNNIESISLDYIRTDGVVTDISLADITAFVSELAAKTTCKIGVDSLANKLAITSHKQDAVSWISNGYIDEIIAMGYESSYSVKWEYLSGYDFITNGKPLIWGHGAMTSLENPSDFAANILRYQEQGHYRISVFDWGDDLRDNSDYGDIIDDMHDSTLSVSMGDVTKIVVVPGTSIALTIGGTEYTTLNADVTDHTTQGALKAHIEAVEGSRPYVYYLRKTAGYIQIMIGDFEP